MRGSRYDYGASKSKKEGFAVPAIDNCVSLCLRLPVLNFPVALSPLAGVSAMCKNGGADPSNCRPVFYFVTIISVFDLFIVKIFSAENVRDSVAVGTIVSKQLRPGGNKNCV